MGSLLNTLLRTAILDDAAYQEWRERPNLFLRGIVLIIVVSLVAGLVSFALNLVSQVQPVDVDAIMDGMTGWYEWFPTPPDPEFQEFWEDMVDVMAPMITDLSEIRAPLPRGVTGFFNALGTWVSRALTAIGGWLFYGALVLIFVNLLGGSAKLPDFLGTVALYVVPGLLGLLGPIPCLGWLLVFIAMVWSIVVYIKATSVVTNLDAGRAIVAVIAPFFALILLGILLGALTAIWFAILF